MGKMLFSLKNYILIQIVKTNTKHVHLSKYGDAYQLENFERFESDATKAAQTPPWTEERFPIPTRVSKKCTKKNPKNWNLLEIIQVDKYLQVLKMLFE